MKRCISAILAFVLCFACLPIMPVLAKTDNVRWFGDYNGDGVVSSADWLNLSLYLMDEVIDLPDSNCCDMDSDGSFTSADALELKQTVMGLKSAKVYVETDLVVYPLYDSRIERDYEYSVTVTQNGITKSLACYNHTDAVATSERVVNGDTVRRFCEFAFNVYAVRVDITVNCDFDSYTVMPSAKGFESSINGNVISVYLDKPDYFLLKLDDSDDSILAVFADKPETDVPNSDDEGVIYIDGWYEPVDGVLSVGKENTTVYIAPGAVLNARLVLNAKGCSVRGRGMILDPYSNIYDYDVSTATQRYLVSVHYPDCTVEGIKLVDSRDYNLVTRQYCTNLAVKDVKMLSSEMCTDGISQYTGKNFYRHCFIYVGDNAIVVTDGTDCIFEDITIGTICAALFPQLGVGELEFNDIYVFRCDEGLVRNIYNGDEPASAERTFTMTVNNINAVDCDHFAYLFVGRNMGTLSKKIIFNNCAVPDAAGSNVLGKGDGLDIRIENGTNYLYTDNYDIEFNNLSIDGQAITDASQLAVYNNKSAEVKFTVTGNGAVDMPVVPAAKTAPTVSPDKIYVGMRRLKTANAVQTIDGVKYLPADDIEDALCFDISDEYIRVMRNRRYVTVDDLINSGATTSVYYDDTSKSVIISASHRYDNLLTWGGNSIHSRWCEVTPWKTHVVTRNLGQEIRLIGGSANTGCGMNLTQQVRQYGGGTYRFTFDVRTDVESTVEVRYGADSVKQSHIIATAVTDWQTVTIDFTQEDFGSENELKNAYVYILQCKDDVIVRFKNAELVYVG